MNAPAILLSCLLSITGIWSRWHENDGQWDRLAGILRDNGYDTVFYMAAYGPEINGQGLQECLDACLPLGIDVHAWVVMWRTDYASDSLREVLDSESRLQAYSDTYNDGETIRNWMNPTDPRNVELMADICQRIAAEYPVTGVHLDYIRYNYYLSGYSQATRERFQEECGVRYLDWPGDCLKNGSYYDTFMQWRAGKITAAVRAVRDSLSRMNKVVQLSAAVMPHTREMLLYGQLWDEWLEDGLMDFVVTMNYTQSDSQFAVWGEEQVPLAGDGTILCGISVKSNVAELTAQQAFDQIQMSRELGFDGYVVFKLCDEVVERLMRGSSSEPAPEEDEDSH